MLAEHDASVNRSLVLRGRALALEEIIQLLPPAGNGGAKAPEENTAEERIIRESLL